MPPPTALARLKVARPCPSSLLQLGPVSSVRICTDAVSRRSLGYAYVNFVDTAAAQKALETLNYTPIRNRPMRIMWSQRDPQVRKSGVGNIFIKNLDKSIDTKALHDTFSQFGPILSCKVAIEADGSSKGYGFVHFEREEDAAACIDQVNGKEIEGKTVTVGAFLPRAERPSDREVRFTNVFVKNLPDSVDSDDKLEAMFKPYGSITSAVTMKDAEGKSRGFGFVNFSKAEEAQEAVKALNEKELDGKTVYVGRAQKKSERMAILTRMFEERKKERIAKYQGLNLYVKYLPDDVDDQKLRELFSEFGTITSAKVMTDEKGTSRSFGFVCFSNADEAGRALGEMNNRTVAGKPLYVAMAQRREVRRQQLESQFRMRGMGGPQGMPMGFPGGFGAPGFFPGFPPRGGMGGYGPMMGFGRGGFAGRGAQGGRGGRGDFMGREGADFAGRGGRGGRGMGPGGRGVGPMGVQPGRGGRGGRFPNGGRGPAGAVPGGQPAPPTQPPAPAPKEDAPKAAAGQDFATLLASLPEDQRKNALGERLYPEVQKYQPDLAGKITGMFLEMDVTELLGILQDPAQLKENIKEAIDVLRQASAIPDGAKVLEM